MGRDEMKETLDQAWEHMSYQERVFLMNLAVKVSSRFLRTRPQLMLVAGGASANEGILRDSAL